MRSATLIVVLALSATALAADDRPAPAAVTNSINRGLAFLKKDAIAWKAEHNCVSCHHAGLVIWSMHEAKQRGYGVDGAFLAEMTGWVARDGDGKTGIARPEGVPKALNTKAVILSLGLAAAGRPDEAALTGMKTLTETIKGDQLDSGAWASWPDTRPPIFGPTDEKVTVLAALALLPAAKRGDEAARAARDRAIKWLDAHHDDDDPQTLAMRVVLWTRLGRPARQWRPLVKRIIDRQQADGGWRQTDDKPSDAFATGQAHYALAHAGVKPDDPIITRAHAFLIKTQRDDGAWPMTPRPNKPGDEPSGNVIPITGAGAAWGVLGLVRSSADRPPRDADE